MPMIQVEANNSAGELLTAAEQLSMPELDQLVTGMLALRARRHAPSLSEKETGLLEGINEGLPPVAQARYCELAAKREAETLSLQEHEELRELIDRMEHLQARRVRLLSELAQLRGTTVDNLMDELGLRPRENG